MPIGQGNYKFRSEADGAFQAKVTAEHIDYLSDDGQPQAGPALRPAGLKMTIIGLHKGVEDHISLMVGDSGSGVLHRDLERLPEPSACATTFDTVTMTWPRLVYRIALEIRLIST